MKKILFTLFFFCLTGISFAQNEPLWMRYPAISPDGQTIVFSYKGDLYSVNSKGGKATLLTSHQAYDFMPVWSKDGNQIAFASDRYGNFDIFIVDAKGGEPKRLTYFSSNDFPSDFTPDSKNIIFTSSRLDLFSNQLFPTGALPELYSISVSGGQEKQLLTTPAEWAKYNPDGSLLVFQDSKGYEDEFRKHHTSAIAKDVWTYNTLKNEFKKITSYNGEDRNPVFSKDGAKIYYMSEESGSFNVYQSDVNGSSFQAVTKFTKHPVRYLSISNDETLCFTYDGEIYTKQINGEPVKVKIEILTDLRTNQENMLAINSDATEMAVSPNGKEIALIVRGEVFVCSMEGGFSKQITNTPEQERNVSFSPDGKSILYAGERNQSWNIYQTSLVRKEEKYFFNGTLLKEEALIATDVEEFQPAYSPDSKEIAYLEERTILKVFNIATKQSRLIMDAKHNYSYSDGDQWYHWSPDGKWFLVNFFPEKKWITEVGLINASGNEQIINLTQSGYNDGYPQWVNEGNLMIWYSDREGMKNQASWGTEDDVYAMYFNQEAFDRAKLTKEEYTLLKEQEDEKNENEEEKEEKKDKKKEDKKPEIKPINIELEGIDKRKLRLTIHSSSLGGAVLSKDGEKLYYLTMFEKGYDLWVTTIRTKETKILTKLNAESVGDLIWDKEGKKLFFISDGSVNCIAVSEEGEEAENKVLEFNLEMLLDTPKERAYMFEHIWRQVVKKFYVKDLHQVDWDFYKTAYLRFLPHINNNYDFAEMTSELLGELNASHTGCFYSPDQENGDATALLGVFLDENYTGNGLKIVEVLNGGPLDRKNSKIKPAVVIEKIDGISISSEISYYQLLNRKAGKYVLLSLYDEKSKQRWEEVIKPITRNEQRELLYMRWVDRNRAMVEKLSGGKLGYVHVLGMDVDSYKTVYEDVIGKYYNKEGMIIDTRFNGGGWLHDDLATFFNGKTYARFLPRGQDIGDDPQFKWNKPSVVVIGESNYSDAHIFPYTYKALGIGKLVGMPIPGTGTAVWWEDLIDDSLTFGIPEVGVLNLEGKFLENTQLEPDYKISLEYDKVSLGIDQQLEKAIEVLLGEKK